MDVTTVTIFTTPAPFKKFLQQCGKKRSGSDLISGYFLELLITIVLSAGRSNPNGASSENPLGKQTALYLCTQLRDSPVVLDVAIDSGVPCWMLPSGRILYVPEIENCNTRHKLMAIQIAEFFISDMADGLLLAHPPSLKAPVSWKVNTFAGKFILGLDLAIHCFSGFSQGTQVKVSPQGPTSSFATLGFTAAVETGIAPSMPQFPLFAARAFNLACGDSQFGFSGGDAWVSICTAARPPTPPRPSACGQALGPVNAAATSAPPSASAKKSRMH
mmetsp:Transcript_27617/g.40619  ORF Transcript_27617/g.40619 Transcript_27617/m.40619 type:complete len:274 (-) Transcript_27617:45-866(-)